MLQFAVVPSASSRAPAETRLSCGVMWASPTWPAGPSTSAPVPMTTLPDGQNTSLPLARELSSLGAETRSRPATPKAQIA